MLGAAALVFQVGVAAITVHGSSVNDVLVMLLNGQTLVMVLSFPIVAPLLRWLLHEPRPLRVVESLTGAAVAVVLFLGLESIVLSVVGMASGKTVALSAANPLALFVLTILLAVCCLAGPPLGPRVQRTFLLRGRRPADPK